MPSDDAASTFPSDAAHADPIDVLKSDIAAIRDDLRTLGQHAGESARSRVQQARMRFSDMSKSAREKGAHARDELKVHIEENPFASVGIALGAGLLLGFIIARR